MCVKLRCVQTIQCLRVLYQCWKRGVLQSHLCSLSCANWLGSSHENSKGAWWASEDSIHTTGYFPDVDCVTPPVGNAQQSERMHLMCTCTCACRPPPRLPPCHPSSQKSSKLRSENSSIFQSKLKQLGSKDTYLNLRRWRMKLREQVTWLYVCQPGYFEGKRVMFRKGTLQNTEGCPVENCPTQSWLLYHFCCLS